MKLQKLYSYTRKAIEQYKMIDQGDKIAIALSGGKDSLALLYSLAGLRRFYPKKFELVAITVDLGFDGFDASKLKYLCEDLDVEYHIIATDIAEIVFEIRQESNPCSLCATMRKGAMNSLAKELKCNKIALGHNKEDFIETMMLSLFYEGRFNVFSPVSYLDRLDLYSIRPLLFVPEDEIKNFINRYNPPIIFNPCPVDKHTKRETMKNLILELENDFPDLRQKLFRAILNSKLKGWN